MGNRLVSEAIAAAIWHAHQALERAERMKARGAKGAAHAVKFKQDAKMFLNQVKRAG